MGKPRLLDQVRKLIQLRNMSRRTAKAYLYWIKRFIFFHDKRHPCELGAEEIAAFLSHLALDQRVAASTQNQALKRLPVVLTREEVERVLTPPPTLCSGMMSRFGESDLLSHTRKAQLGLSC